MPSSPRLDRIGNFRSAFALAVIAMAVISVARVSAQTTYTYTGAANGTWLNSMNWTGGVANKYPGVDANASSTADGTTTDIAAIGVVGSTATATNININFGTSTNSGVGNSTAANGSLTLGTVDLLATANRAISITNSSSTLDGTLTLTGNTLNTIANTILANEGSQSVTLTNGSSKRMDLALGNTTNNVIQINGSGNMTITSMIKNGTGASNLTLTSTGTPTGQLVLNSPTANTFTGTTTVDKGTMNLVTAGSLGSTSGITVNTGGTLLLSGTAGLDRINNAATMTLNGGKFNTGGLSEGTASATGAGIGALTLTANSTIDFGSGTSILHFAGLGAHTQISGPDLTITNWSGSVSGGGTDELLFTGSASQFIASYDQSDVSFNGITGYNTVQLAGFYEVTAIPEPSTWVAAALALAAVGFTQKKRFATLLASAASKNPAARAGESGVILFPA